MQFTIVSVITGASCWFYNTLEEALEHLQRMERPELHYITNRV
ncbi:hypothetical protein POK33_29295 [Burkholderia cenocepacia]|nr:hypothetical protein [Burkholderia cenocepacia]MDF0504834.1 hypothetical protein [Burkholderia cenocepacia]